MAEEIFHVGIKALIMNEEAEILMLEEHFSDGGVQHDIPGGRMEREETFRMTLLRELREEIGISVIESSQLYMTVLSNKKITNSNGTFGLILVIFRVTLPAGMNPRATEPNVTLMWRPIAEAQQLLRDKYPAEFCENLVQN